MKRTLPFSGAMFDSTGTAATSWAMDEVKRKRNEGKSICRWNFSKETGDMCVKVRVGWMRRPKAEFIKRKLVLKWRNGKVIEKITYRRLLIIDILRN